MPTKIDIIILSFAKNEELKGLTIQTINTLMASEDPTKIQLNVLVIESNKALAPYQFEHSKTIYPAEKFGFNKFLNIGIKATNNEYICLCNNDLIFHRGWASALLSFTKESNTDKVVLSPFCKVSHRYFLEQKEPIEGYLGYFAGHCFFTTRKTLEIIGHLDEKINFWYADLDFINLLNKNNIPHYLVPQAEVSHLISKVTAGFSKLDTLKYTYYPYIYYRYKWEDKSIFLYTKRMMIYAVKYIIYSIRDNIKKISRE